MDASCVTDSRSRRPPYSTWTFVWSAWTLGADRGTSSRQANPVGRAPPLPRQRTTRVIECVNALRAALAPESVLAVWIEPSDDVYEVIDVATDRVVDRWRVVYRFRVRNPSGDFVCEQTAYYHTAGERILKLRVLCSGFLPAPSER